MSLFCRHEDVDELRNEAGELIGIRCPACGTEVYKGESTWAALKRVVRNAWRDARAAYPNGERGN